MPFLDAVLRRIGVVAHCLGSAAVGSAGLGYAAPCVLAGLAYVLAHGEVVGEGSDLQAAVVEVREPHLLGGEPEPGLVEDAGVRHEAVEDVAVYAHQVVGAVAAVGRAAAGHLAHEGLSLELPGGAEIVLHVEADVVAADLLLPFLAEGGGAAAVGHHYDVALLRHQAVAPAVAPVLAVGALRAAEDYGDGGIDLALVELGRIHHPGLHALAVDGADLPALAGGGVELLKNGVVLVRYGLEGGLALCGKGDLHQLGGEVERHVGAVELGALFR